MFFRPKPKFDVGRLVIMPPISECDFPDTRYFLIERRRWVKPNGDTKKRWVYDGVIFKIEKGGLVLSTFGSCFSEGNFAPFPGIE